MVALWNVRQLTHDAFLNNDGEDPRERFIITLLEAIPLHGAIVTYSAYEKTILKGLGIPTLPPYATEQLIRENSPIQKTRTQGTHP